MCFCVVIACKSKLQTDGMAGTGLCGFHCLSQCLTGNQGSYRDVIEDCIGVFQNMTKFAASLFVHICL